jgi:alanine racemase
VLSRLAGGRPILAVLKNNAYGLGLTTVARIIEPLPTITGFAVVKTSEAISLREAGIRKPVLLMARFNEADGRELVERGVTLSLCGDDMGVMVDRLATRARRQLRVHAYLDTGMSRMGVQYNKAPEWFGDLAGLGGIRIEGTLTELTEDPEFDREQLRRLMAVSEQVRANGGDTGVLHAASSHAVFNFAESHLDMVRPGISIYGAYPTDAGDEQKIAQLKPAFRLRARVIRVAHLQPGDSVSYGRNYVAREPVWVATLPVGHSDGYPRAAVKGGRVLINGATYPVIGAVSASHTIVELGTEPAAQVGDVATLVGPEDPIHPNTLSRNSGASVYDILMHLNPDLPKLVA